MLQPLKSLIWILYISDYYLFDKKGTHPKNILYKIGDLQEIYI